MAEGRLFTRRRAIVAGSVIAATGLGTLALRRPDRGGGHDAYFHRLQDAVRAAGIDQPVMVIDRARLGANIAALARAAQGARLPLRIAVKSLPSPDLLRAVAQGLASDRFMVFNGAMLASLLDLFPGADILTGKPFPAGLVAGLYHELGAERLARVQWLVDTPQRIAQYAEIARATGARMKLSFEIDVGLHRGGFVGADELAQALGAARQAGVFTIAGLMGYDAHVAKMGDPEAAYREAQVRYGAARRTLESVTGQAASGFTLNSAGSLTVMRHTRGTLANEVSVGSAFVKPADFDVPDNGGLIPAAFIATPVIKAGHALEVPGHEYLDAPLRFLDPNSAQAVYIFGGHWLADPVSPPGLEYNALIGRSSNQELLTGSRKVLLAPDDRVFLRPRQSEAVLLQFGDLALYEGGRITARWPTFPVSA